MTDVERQYDLFICHASEDKEDLVCNLAVALRNLGLDVWYDDFSLNQGDSLSESIDRGLASSRFGVVVLSRAFFVKSWPLRELQGLVALEIAKGKVILPIWHGVSHKEVVDFSPPLADKIAFKTANVDAATLALQILLRVRPELYNEHSREDLQRMAGESVIAALQDKFDEIKYELEQTRDELSEFQCPVCRAKLVYSTIIDCEQDDYRFESYDCGYESRDGWRTHPCKYDPDFPTAEDYELSTSGDSEHGFVCFAHGKTHMAQLVPVFLGQGATAEEAESDVRQRLPRRRELPPDSNVE